MLTPDNDTQRTVILTGASRGIGHATVKRFAHDGWRVITCSRQPFDVACPWDAGPENHIQIDLSDPHSVESGLEQMRDRLQDAPLHALVNNAGISPKGPKGDRYGSLETPFDLWHQVFEVNFFAPIRLARGLLEALKLGEGSIVNVTSIAGSRVHRFAGAAYATSKAALAGLTREMAADFGPYGIRVNSIAPGEINTAILSPGTEDIVDQLPLRRLGTPDEVADAIYYLCSAQSSYVTGSELHINGGQHV